MITGIDRAVARVLEALEQAGLAGNTIVVYSADNGYYLGDRGFQGKWSHYEESLRVPLIIDDPRVAGRPEGRPAAGRVIPAMALNVDLPATFLDWAGVTAPASYQGRSLAPFVAGKTPADWRQSFFCEHLDLEPHLTWEGIRGERYVYARYFDQQPAFEFLHDLRVDPDELRNFASDPGYTAVIEELRGRCDAEVAAKGGPILPPSERHPRKAAARKKQGER
jgi:arylsulfatase A-like enzyme